MLRSDTKPFNHVRRLESSLRHYASFDFCVTFSVSVAIFCVRAIATFSVNCDVCVVVTFSGATYLICIYHTLITITTRCINAKEHNGQKHTTAGTGLQLPKVIAAKNATVVVTIATSNASNILKISSKYMQL